MPSMKFRIRTPKSTAPQELELDEEAPWIGVLYELEALSGISSEKIRVLSGFPPKPILADDSALVRDLQLRANDLLTVQEGEARVQVVNTGERYVPPAPEKAHFTRRICPSDNSCLFHACAYVLKNKNRTDGALLRRQCVETVLSQRDLYNQNTIGMGPEEYATWLKQKDSWGGAIELQILSNLYETEIIALDLESSTMQRFGEGHSLRAFVVYTGNHYDAVAMNIAYNAATEHDDQVLFNTRDENVVSRAQRFVKEEGEKIRLERASQRK